MGMWFGQGMTTLGLDSGGERREAAYLVGGVTGGIIDIFGAI